MAVFEMRNARKAFGALEVLKGVSLKVEKGEVVSIIGPSGGGKSTMLRCATLLETMDSGTLAYGENVAAREENGKSVYAGKAALAQVRRQFGLVFQQFDLFPHYTVLKNVCDAPISVQKRDRSEVEAEAMALLDKMGLKGKENAYPYQLSGGQQQRVAIARALVNNPRMIIADEPTPGLDLEMALETLKIFRELADEGKAIVLITHDIDLAFHIADRVAVFYAGTTLEIADAKDFLEGPEALRHPYSKALWKALPQNGFEPVPGFQPYAKYLPGGCLYFPRCPHRSDECEKKIPMKNVRGGRVRCIYAD